jgi:hypothetical protein
MLRSHGFRRRDGLRGAALAVVALAGVVGSACGSDAGAEPARESILVLEAYEDGETYGYRAVGTVDLRVGDRLTIDLRNVGALIHDLAVIHPDGNTVATLAAIAGGTAAALEIDLEDPGIYRLNCNVENHLTEHGMQAFVEVKDADGTSTAS